MKTNFLRFIGNKLLENYSKKDHDFLVVFFRISVILLNFTLKLIFADHRDAQNAIIGSLDNLIMTRFTNK